MKELAADGIPVAVTCRVLKLARQPYYRWLANPITDAEYLEAHRADALFDAHRDDPEFGYRFLVTEAADVGRPMAERTGWRICSTNGWWSAFGKKRGKNSRPGAPVHDDLVDRDFTASAPNQLWLSDIIEHRTAYSSSRRNGWDQEASSKAASRSAGVSQLSVLRGRPLSSSATARSSWALCCDRSAPRGKYCRNRPLVFSLLPRCQGAPGSAK